MPKGLKRALAAAKRSDENGAGSEDEDAMMELEAAKRIMEEQTAERAALQADVAEAKKHAYNKVRALCGVLQAATQTTPVFVCAAEALGHESSTVEAVRCEYACGRAL
jgi:hypothetical protein